MSKKALTILILFLLILAGIGFYLYTLFGNKPVAPDLTTGNYSPNSPQSNFNPLNTAGQVSTNTSGSNPNISQNTGTSSAVVLQIPVLRQISTTPIAGAFASTTASTTVIRFIDRGTGHVFETTSETTNLSTISNTTIPKVYDALWDANGKNVLLRMLDDNSTIQTFLGQLHSLFNGAAASTSPSSLISTTPNELRGDYLSTDIKEIALSPKKDRMFYLTRTTGTLGYIASLDQIKNLAVFNSPVKFWRAEWPEENTIALTTAAASNSVGYLYFMNLKGDQTKILGDVWGLTTLVSKDAQHVFYTASVNNSVRTFFYNIKGGVAIETGARTLAEKCVWSAVNKSIIYCSIPIEIPIGNYPEAWYQGKISFTDSLWYINADTGEITLLSNIYKDSGKSIDAINLFLDNKENYLFFTNKKDLTLWSLKLPTH